MVVVAVVVVVVVVVVVPCSVVVELVQQAPGQHSAVLVDEYLLAAVDADQQADDVRGAPLGARLVWWPGISTTLTIIIITYCHFIILFITYYD